MKNSEKKVVFITGGSRGIGAAIAESFAKEEYRVVFTYRNSEEASQRLEARLKTYGVRAEAVRVDNSDTEALQKAIARVIKDYGAIHTLVNNAGVCPEGPLESFTTDDFQSTMDINVKAVFTACQAVIPQMSEGGRIINIGSNMADMAYVGDLVLYATSKAALQGMTKSMARSLGKRRITVNLVQPGPINTDMNPKDTEKADFLRNLMALPEYGKPHDIGNFVTFLAGEQGSYFTGSVLTIDGGMNA